MAVNFIYWENDEGYDIHLVAGATSRTLNDLLVINHGNPPVNVRANEPPPRAPPDVTVSFIPNFISTLSGTTYSGFGITVDAKSGAVTAPNPIPACPHNFLIRAQVVDGSVAGTMTTFMKEIRIHVHKSVSNAWLTPNPLDIRRGADGLRFTVLAEFDDDLTGPSGSPNTTIGDISRISGMAWVSSGLGVSVNVDSAGKLTALVNSTQPPHPTISAILPPLYGSKVASANVHVLAPWATPVPAKLISGSADSNSPATAPRMKEVRNFLLLPDGFLHDEQQLFERTTQAFVNFLRTSPATRPFDLCSPEMNFWMAWIESGQRGTSPLYEIKQVPRATSLVAKEVEAASTPAPTAAAWSLPQLIHEVGLPIPAHAGVAFRDQLIEWIKFFGVVVALHVNAALHADWVKLANRQLINEQNTAFGIALGERPKIDLRSVPRSMAAHPFRTTRAHLDAFLTNLENADAPAGSGPIGAVWGPLGPDGRPGPNGEGKDRPFVVMLCAGSREGGARSLPPKELIAVGLTIPSEIEIELVMPTGGVDLVPYQVPNTIPLDACCTVAHESAHALGLGDEYGAAGTLPPEWIPDVNTNLNLQDVKSATAAAGVGLDPALLKWNWPRIKKAGVLTKTPDPSTDVPGDYSVQLKRGHGNGFKAGQFVRFRTRPLKDEIVSIELQITKVDHDTIQVHPTVPGFMPVVFVAGSILYQQQEGPPIPPATRGPPLNLISPTVFAHMNVNGIPLNAPIPHGAYVCTPDPRVVQPAENYPVLPPGKPKYRAWIVGAFEGGRDFGCGVLHPTGACMMRRLLLPPKAAIEAFGVNEFAYRFCPVCRYIMVDAIDPSQHGVIDADYDPKYAEP